MNEIKDQIRMMVDDTCDEYEVVRFIAGQEEAKRTELHLFMEKVFMEDEYTEESRDGFLVMERMWNKVMFRVRRRMPGREILDWIDQVYARCIIGPHTWHELHERLADYWDEREQEQQLVREERLYMR